MKQLLLIGAVALSTFISAQTTVFSADFESTVGWSLADRDGDTYNWGISNLDEPFNGFSPGNLAVSESWIETGALTPDNLLISPAIVLPTTGTLNLSFKVGGADATYYEEHYAVYAIPSTSTFSGTETPLLEQTLTSQMATTVNVDLSSFAGQTVNLVFRHFKVSDQFLLLLDDVLVTRTALSTANASSSNGISVFPNPTSDYLNFSSKVNSIQIFDLAGRNLSSPEAVNNQLDVRNLEKGAYMVKFETENGMQTQKFIKK